MRGRQRWGTVWSLHSSVTSSEKIQSVGHVFAWKVFPRGCYESGDGLSQFAAQDFAGCCLGNRVDETDFTGLLVMRESVGDESAEFFSEFVAFDKSVAQGDEGNRNFSGFWATTADDSALFHRRMFQQNGFDLGRGHRKAFVFDHFLAAVYDAVETFTIAGDDVA